MDNQRNLKDSLESSKAIDLEQTYDRAFYGDQQAAYMSAQQVLTNLRAFYKPSSVIDVGCGLGTWLKVWRELDSSVFVAGLDGNAVEDSERFIPKSAYAQVDLTKDVAHLQAQAHALKSGGGGGQNAPSQKPFALAQSLEVAEHLDQKFARNFVQLLTSLADVVLFSAAIPYQGGVCHINEQPPSYWADLFAEQDFVCLDFLRPRLWSDESVLWWYRQNLLVFVHRDSQAALFPTLSPSSPAYLPHPIIWEEKNKWLESLLNAHSNKPLSTGLKLIAKWILMKTHLLESAKALLKAKAT